MKRILYSVIIIAVLLISSSSLRAGEEMLIPLWHVHDFPFKSETVHDNPFLVTFSAYLEGPDGIALDVPGFFDGDGTWKIRFSAIREGEWILKTKSDDAALDGITAAFRCIENDNPAVHGGLLTDPKNPHHFMFEDGTRYFLMGYECDWLWALGLEKGNLKIPFSFLDTLVRFRFNHVILNAYAHDTGWRKGDTGPDDYGPPPYYAWEGTNENPVHDRFNLTYWKHYDRIIRAMNDRGIIAHIMIKVYNKMVNWPEPGSRQDDLFFTWMIARYSAFSNIVWDFSKEAHNEKDRAYKVNRFRFIKNIDPYHRLITIHDDDAAYESGTYNSLVDFRSDQQHTNWHRMTLHQRAQRRWPVVNVEFGYEHGLRGMDDKTYDIVQSPEEVLRRAWEICMAGGYPAYYYTNTAWDVIMPDEIPPGYEYFKMLSGFFQSTRYWLMEPHDELVSRGYCLAEPGREYVVFLNKRERFSFIVDNTEGPLVGQWFDPLTGRYTPAGTFINGIHEAHPPGEDKENPIVLYISND